MTIWYRDLSVAELNSRYQINMIHHLGIQLTALGAETLTGTMPVDVRTKQPFGSLHGGASVVLAETLGSLASNLCLDSDRYLAVGQSISASHLKGVKEGHVTGTATPLHLGKGSHVWHMDLVDDQGERVCSATLTTRILTR